MTLKAPRFAEVVQQATGAGIQSADRYAVATILAHARANDYGFRTLVHEGTAE